ncbi:MAG: hypothetical protein OEZ06_13675 [Myxococcales bacterium]|nr:hypothetical protein [Myxococcales bacterium]
MDWSLTLDEENGALRVVASGPVALVDVTAVTHAIVEHPAWRPGQHVLADYRETDHAHLGGLEVKQLARAMRDFAESLGEGRCALLVNGLLMYGLARMWAAYAELHFGMRVRVFREEAEAKARRWLMTPS